MRRRYPTLLTSLGAALVLSLGLQPASSQADGIAGTADYTLTTTTALPAPTGPPPGTPSVTLSSTLSNGSATVNVPSTSGVAVGYEVSGTGIPTGTTVSQISSGRRTGDLEPERDRHRGGKPGVRTEHFATSRGAH